jgi:hypothetical protein
MAGLSFDRARAKRAVLATCVVAALSTAGIASARGKHPLADADSAKASFPREAMQRWLDTPRWMQTPLMAATRSDGDGKGYGVSSIVPVTTCEDDLSAGSLRKVLEGAQDNDIVDLNQLTCSTITLQHGELSLTADRVKVFGPSDHLLTIDANSHSRAFHATSANKTFVYDLNFSNGSVSSTPYAGGCLYVRRGISLTRVSISHCTVTATHALRSTAGGPVVAGGPLITGGGVFAAGDLDGEHINIHDNRVDSALSPAWGGGLSAWGQVKLVDSKVTANEVEANSSASTAGIYGHDVTLYGVQIDSNHAHSFVGSAIGAGVGGGGASTLKILLGTTITNNAASSDNGMAEGGGIYGDQITLDRSSVSGNTASSGSTSNARAVGGGIFTRKELAASYSTIDGNRARCMSTSATSQCSAIGGGLASYGPSSDDIALTDVTVSGNSAESGVRALGGGVFIDGDKALIAESSTIAFNHSTGAGGGVVASSPSATPTTLHNALVTNNDIPSGGSDFANGNGTSLSITGWGTIVQHIEANVVLPIVWLTAEDPHLAPLADNGGATKTHAIDDQSSAFDAGVDSGATMPKCDQRGAGYQRIVGANPDIGAYELQDPLHGDPIFFDGFNPKGTDACNF